MLVDFHAAPGDTTVLSGNLIRDWQTLWRLLSSRPAFATALAGRVFLDIINEPDGLGLRYRQSGETPPCVVHRDIGCPDH